MVVSLLAIVVTHLDLWLITSSANPQQEFAEMAPSLNGQPYDLYRMDYTRAATAGECLLYCSQKSNCVGFAHSKVAEGCMLYWNIPILKRSETTTTYSGDFVFYLVKRDRCPDSYSFADSYFFKIHPEKTSWMDAKNLCASEGAHLFLLDSEKKRQLLISEIEIQGFDGQHLWVDGNDIGQEGMWLTWKSENYTTNMWNVNEPNDVLGFENCLEIGPAYLLNDYSCTTPVPFVCECEVFNNRCT